MQVLLGASCPAYLFASLEETHCTLRSFGFETSFDFLHPVKQCHSKRKRGIWAFACADDIVVRTETWISALLRMTIC